MERLEMKNEKEIKKQLEDVYEYRFALRLERKTKRNCRNCVWGVENTFDIGEFGKVSKWECKQSQKFSDKCTFKCKYTNEDIEKEMMEDISDPSICGAKEPKIAALLWVLHDGKQSKDKQTDAVPENINILQKILGVFRGRK